MGAFWCLVAVLVSEIVYNTILSDDSQTAVEWYVMHGQFALAMFGSVLAYSYVHPLGKGATAIGFLWSFTLALTDWWVPPEPRWAAAVAPVGFLIWLIYLWRKHEAIQSGKRTGRNFGLNRVSRARKGRGRSADR